MPRPSVVVIIKFMEQGAQKDYRNMEGYFEVYRRHPSGAKEETKVYETGLVWPQDKAIDASNTQHITFGIEELVGTLEMINKAIRMRDNLNDIDDKYTRNMLQDVSADFLHMVKDKKTPSDFQRGQDTIIAEELGTKPKASDDVLAGQEKPLK
ncbi:hypothetical protein OEA41_008404 [Lepraria neglecta]|uniref:Uncharacterized protein n=1 Tax=Lepraria neglecta TaxID=209136 RepID=A0AAD9ZED9_9LECA|nr:hypothetical protein OEA41_008404 [Lepraria neglecta]